MFKTVPNRAASNSASAFRKTWRCIAVLAATAVPSTLMLTPALSASTDTDIVCVETTREIISAPAPVDDDIIDLGVDGEDLRVQVRWGSSPASHALISLNDAANSAVSSVFVERLGDVSDIVIPGALESVPERGFQFTVDVTPEGETDASDEVDFRVDLECPNDEPCGFTLLPGVWSAGPVVSSDLLALLDDAPIDSDFIADVWATFPEQRPAIRSFLWQLGLGSTIAPPSVAAGSRGDGEQASGDAANGCDCQWITSISITPGLSFGSATGTTPRHQAGGYGASGELAAAVQSVDGTLELDLDDAWHDVSLGMHLRCWEVASMTDQQLATLLPSRPEIILSMPSATTCEGCPGTITSTATVDACVEGQTSGAITEAESTLQYLYALEGSTLLANALAVTAWHPDGSYSHQQKGANGTSTRITQGVDAVGTVSHKALLSAVVVPSLETGAMPYAFAAGRLDASLTSHGKATCAEDDGEALLFPAALSLNGATGGVLMKQWGP